MYKLTELNHHALITIAEMLANKLNPLDKNQLLTWRYYELRSPYAQRIRR